MSRLDDVKRIAVLGTLLLTLGCPASNQPTEEPPLPNQFTADELAQLLGKHAWKLQLQVPPQKNSVHIGMFTEKEVLEDAKLRLSRNAYTINIALSFRVGMRQEMAEAGIILDNGTSTRTIITLPPWFVGMPRTHDPKLVGNRYAVLSMEKDEEETVHYGFWRE